MLHRGRSNGAEVIALHRPVGQGIRLTVADRMEVARRTASLAGTGVDRLVIHERLPWDPPELGDFLSIYRDGKPWACCSIVRERGRLFAWCAISGREFGRFETMAAALASIVGPSEHEAVRPHEAPRRRPWLTPPTSLRVVPTHVAAAACLD